MRRNLPRIERMKRMHTDINSECLNEFALIRVIRSIRGKHFSISPVLRAFRVFRGSISPLSLSPCPLCPPWFYSSPVVLLAVRAQAPDVGGMLPAGGPRGQTTRIRIDGKNLAGSAFAGERGRDCGQVGASLHRMATV